MVHHEFFLDGRGPKPKCCPLLDDDKVTQFCEANDFLALMKLFRGLKEEDCTDLAQQTVDRYLTIITSMLLEASRTPDISSVILIADCPAVWDTGALYVLTPF